MRLRRWNPWKGLRKPTYKRNAALHFHEDWVLLPLIYERGDKWRARTAPALTAKQWARSEPGRWAVPGHCVQAPEGWRLAVVATSPERRVF